MTDNVVFLEPGDERAHKIAKAMGSQTASDILQILGDGPRSLTDITDRLNVPMNTAKYHIGNLLDAGLIAVAETKYSIKGREVKIYSLANQLLIVAPRRSDVRSLLLKYASLFGIVTVSSVIISLISHVAVPGLPSAGSVNEVPSIAFQEGCGSIARGSAESIAPNATTTQNIVMAGYKAVQDTAAQNVTSIPEPVATLSQIPHDTVWSSVIFPPDPALTFFLGGLLVIFVLLCYEAWLWKKH